MIYLIVCDTIWRCQLIGDKNYIINEVYGNISENILSDNGTVRSKRILIPSINLTYSGSILPFNLQRTQSPIIPVLAMTISLKEKRFLKNWNIFESARFIHAQLYIAAK